MCGTGVKFSILVKYTRNCCYYCCCCVANMLFRVVIDMTENCAIASCACAFACTCVVYMCVRV